MPKINGHGQAEIFSDSDYAKLRRQLKNPQHRLIFDLARWTGERWGAILQLRVEDVYDRQGKPRDWITFRAATRKASPGGERSTRQCPTHERLAEILRAYRPPSYGYLFPGAGAGPLSYQSAYSFFHRALARAGMEDRGFSTHSFRRTLITRLSEAGVALATIQQITGHRDLKSLQRYIERDPKRAQRAMAVLG